MDYASIACSCGHKDSLDNFCKTPVFGELPPGQFQCPGCGAAWKRKEGGHKLLRAGKETMIIPTTVSIVPLQGRL